MESSIAYEAKIVKNKFEGGEKLPTIKEIVKYKVLNSGILKKEEIDEFVCKKIGLPMDESIAGATSAALKKLEAENFVEHISHGYWRSK